MSEDLIRRSDVIEVLYKNTPFNADGIALLNKCENEIRAIPSADVIEPKRGEWIDFKNGWKCNACEKWNSEKSNFCPNCGADMKGADDE